MKELKSIDDVIDVLEHIIDESRENNNPMGYFAALYQKVTIKVKEGIAEGAFEDGPQMEQLDIVFAKRYLDAYHAYRKNEPVTDSWEKAFDLSEKYWPIVLQHILIGINAHINLDLGIAATEISKGKNIDDLKNDFDKINDILSSLVNQVQENLSEIWPTLKKILVRVGKVDDFLVDFSMLIARDGAWQFAVDLASKSIDEQKSFIKGRDQKTLKTAKLITNPGWIASILFAIIRIGERGSVSKKIDTLKAP